MANTLKELCFSGDSEETTQKDVGCQVEGLNNRLFLYLRSLTPYSMGADAYDLGTFVIATLTALMLLFSPHVYISFIQ
jgi:hypothetical protein